MRWTMVVGLSAAALAAPWASGADAAPADLRLRVAPNEALRYTWTIATSSESKGKDRGQAFTLTANSSFGVTLLLRGLLPRREGTTGPQKPEGMRVAIRVQDMTYSDKRTIGDAKAEVTIAKGRIRCAENDKVVVDSDNDIGLERLGDYQRSLRSMENAELRVLLDPAGRQSSPEGDAALVETLKGGGAEGIFPILSGKETKMGESWENSFSLPQIGEFKLAKPAAIRSTMTFSKWVAKDGKNLAQVDLVSVWETRELRGENDYGLLVEITQVDGRSTGSCLFDPATGRFVEGAIDTTTKYRIDGEREGQTTGLDVSAKNRFSFAAQPEK